MTKGKGWWSQVTLLRLSQALQDRRCSFAGGGGVGRVVLEGAWAIGVQLAPRALRTEGSRQESTETLRTA